LSVKDDTAVPCYDTPLWRAVAKLASTIGEKLFRSLQTTRSEDPAFKDFEKRMESGGKLTESELRDLRDLGSPEQFFPNTRALIRQKALDGDLTLWGKKQLDNLPEGFTQRQFSDVLTAIPSSYWAVSKIAASAAIESKFPNVPHTQPEFRAAWPNERNSYADLQVNWEQFTGCCTNVPSQPELSVPESGAVDRKTIIAGFIERVTDAGHKITRKDIWTVAGYTDATEFERFQRDDLRGNKSAASAFNRVLSMKPEEFIKLLKVRPN
jgi:hypothetical protein